MLCQLDALGSALGKATICGVTEPIAMRQEPQSAAPVSSSAYSPPRTAYLRVLQSSTTVTAPAKSIANPSKRRRRRRGGDAGDQGGDDGGAPPGDGGGGNWWNGGESFGEGESGPWHIKQNIWAWQAICLCSLLQAAHYLLTQHSTSAERQCAATFAAVFSLRQQSTNTPDSCEAVPQQVVS